MINLLLKISKKDIPVLLVSMFFLFIQALTTLYIPTVMGQMVNNGMITGDINYIYRRGAFMIGLAIVSGFCSFIANFIAAKLSAGFGRDARKLLFNRIESFSLTEFDEIGSASLITRTTNDVTQVQNLLNMAFRSILFSPVMMIGGIYLAVKEDGSLVWVLIVSIIVLLVLIVLVSRYVMPLFKLMQKRVDKLNLVLRESLTGIRVIRAFNKIKYDTAIFEDSNEKLTDVAIKANRIMALMYPFMMVIMNLTIVAIIWFGGLRISEGTMELGNMIAYTQYATTVLFSVIMISIIFIMIPRALVSAERINEVLAVEPIIKDNENTKKIKERKSVLEFKNVCFKYDNADENVLNNISFKSGNGETTAIIGSTGSGKSTLVNLLPRFYDVTSGEVLLDGVNIKELSQKDLRSRVGFIPQSPLLFSGTIAENIRFGKKDASQEEIERAARIAQGSDFIESFPEKYETMISQGGTNVSGGQKQRLSIARALVKNPEVYIFDDSFSALDLKTDKNLRNALKEEIKEGTILIVAQKISTIKDADRIIVLNEGNAVGIGTHEELLDTCKVYKEIALSQLSEEEIYGTR